MALEVDSLSIRVVESCFVNEKCSELMIRIYIHESRCKVRTSILKTSEMQWLGSFAEQSLVILVDSTWTPMHVK